MSLTWSTGPGEGWLDALFPSFQWMQIRPRTIVDEVEPDTPLPTVAPGDVATREVCFRLPDGWSVCTLANDVFATDYGAMGYPEIPQSAPEFVPPVVAEVPGVFEPPVVSSDPQTGVSENAEPVAIEWGTVVQAGLDIATQWGRSQPSTIYNYGGGVPLPSPAPTSQLNGASCNCNSNPCVCGTINGRPALVDPRTGKRCYRRRRRVMLTEGDFNTLLRIATLPNNANVRTALAKAIGRRRFTYAPQSLPPSRIC